MNLTRLRKKALYMGECLYWHTRGWLNPKWSLEVPTVRHPQFDSQAASPNDTALSFYLSAADNPHSDLHQPTPKRQALVQNIQPKFITRQCFICDHPLQALVQVKNKLIPEDYIELSWCQHCDHCQYSVMPQKEWFTQWYKSLYDGETALNHKIAIRKKSYRLYHRLKPLLPKNKKLKILEIGAGFGEKILPFKEAGHDIFCTEATAERAQHLKQHVTPNVFLGTLDDPAVSQPVLANGPYDLILSYHVIEHVFNPRQELQLLKSAVKENSLFYMAIPEFYKEGILNNIFNLEHVASFSRYSGQYLLKQLGFEPIVAKADLFQYYSDYCRYFIGRHQLNVQFSAQTHTNLEKVCDYLKTTLRLDELQTNKSMRFEYDYNGHKPLTVHLAENSLHKIQHLPQHLPITFYVEGMPLFWMQ